MSGCRRRVLRTPPQVRLSHLGRTQPGPRSCRGDDLYSGVSAADDPRHALSTFVSFLTAAGEAYWANVSDPGKVPETADLFPPWVAEVAYINDNELAELAVDPRALRTLPIVRVGASLAAESSCPHGRSAKTRVTDPYPRRPFRPKAKDSEFLFEPLFDAVHAFEVEGGIA